MGGRDIISLVHSHIQGRVLAVGKPPGSRIQLIRGYSQVQIYAVHSPDFQILQYFLNIGVIASDNGHLVLKRQKPFPGRLNGVRILVYADQPSAAQTLTHLIGMSAAAQGSVHIQTSRLDVQTSHCLI